MSAIIKEERIGGQRLILGDCLGAMTSVKSAHAVITDPPYSFGARTTAQMRGRGGMSRGEAWAHKPLPNDRLSVTGFMWLMRKVGLEAERLLVPGGSFLAFTDWRQFPTLYGCIESCNLQIINMVVWDKQVFGMGNGFRNQNELILHAAAGTPRVFDRSVPNVLGAKRIPSSDIHPTENPVELMEEIVRVVTDRGETVFDPFMGSGTTLVACERLGRHGVGVEIDPEYFATACQRVDEAVRSPGLFIAPAEQPKQEALL